jgi:hypothetical protein
VPNPYRVGGLIVDPQGRRSIEWNGERLVVAPFQALDPAQIRIAREALFRRSVERMRSAATQDFAARATKEDPERITTGEAGTAERDPGMTAFYQLLPGRVTMARFDYGGTTQFAVVWQRDGACVTDSVAVAALIAGCHGTDAPGLERAARGIPRTRPPDPDRMGTTWGVIDGSDMPPGTVTVACHGQPTQTAAKPCDERQGDTACRSALPMLCSKADAALPPRSSLARRLALTAPVRGTELLSVGAADKVCQAALGEGWRMTDGEEAGTSTRSPASATCPRRAGSGSAPGRLGQLLVAGAAPPRPGWVNRGEPSEGPTEGATSDLMRTPPQAPILASVSVPQADCTTFVGGVAGLAARGAAPALALKGGWNHTGDASLQDAIGEACRAHGWDRASGHAFEGNCGDYVLGKVGKVFSGAAARAAATGGSQS